VTWRECRTDEHALVASLMLALYEEDPAPTPVTTAGALRTLGRLEAEPVRGRAVLHGDNFGVDAYALLCSFWSNELGGEVCIVDELYVVPSARRRGIASGLIGRLAGRELPWFRDAVALELEVTPGNVRARALYERLGFTRYKNALMRLRL
jgi:GNAT superfamily N-acetyltransferase